LQRIVVVNIDEEARAGLAEIDNKDKEMYVLNNKLACSLSHCAS
jgi:hypothetical protein